MKQIAKQEPQFFREFVEQNSPQLWEEISRKIGHDVRTYMLKKEQNFQCAYTETRVEPENSHIDHFKKQSLYTNLIFEWDNLLTSCNNEAYGAKYKDKMVKNKEDYQYLINPVLDNPHNYFNYAMTGDVLIDEHDEKASITRDFFNLNDYSLVEQRKQVAYQVMAMHKEFSVDELIDFIGKFESFIRALCADFKKNELYHRLA